MSPEGSGLSYVTFEDGVPKAEGEIGGDVEVDIASLVKWLTIVMIAGDGGEDSRLVNPV